MFNAATKTLTGLIILGALAACGNANGTKEAARLVDEANTALEAKNYSLALSLADSVRTAYPRAIDQRREAIHISAVANEGLNLRRLESADSLLAVLGVRADSLGRLVKFVSNPIEGYYIAAGADPLDTYNTTGIQARLSPERIFYIISTLKGKSVNSTSVSVSDGTTSASTATVAHDGERNDRSRGAEVITFMAPECDSVGRYILEHRTAPLTLTFNGRGSYSVKLPPRTVEQTATLYEYAVTLHQAYLASVEKERLTRAIDISRSQAARTFVEKDSVK